MVDILAQGPGFSLPDTAVYTLHLIMKFKGTLWCPGHLFSLSIRKVATYMDIVCPERCYYVFQEFTQCYSYLKSKGAFRS